MAAGDHLLLARIRYSQARRLQHLRHNRAALDVLRLARDQLGAVTPAVDAMLYGAEAASRAAIGDREGALTALGQAREAFAGIVARNEPEWMGFFDKGELLAQHGRVYRDLARRDPRQAGRAVDWVRHAIANFPAAQLRSVVLNQVGLCSAYFLADAPGMALAAGEQATARAAKLTSRRVLDRLGNLGRDAIRHTGDPAVADFLRGLPVRGGGRP